MSALKHVPALLVWYASLLHKDDFMKGPATTVAAEVAEKGIVPDLLEDIHEALWDQRRRFEGVELKIPEQLHQAIEAVEASAVAAGVTLRPKLKGPEREHIVDQAQQTRLLNLPKSNIYCPDTEFEKYEAYETGWYDSKSKEQFLELQSTLEGIEKEIAQGHDRDSHESQLELIEILMASSDWMLDSDKGCIFKSQRNACVVG